MSKEKNPVKPVVLGELINKIYVRKTLNSEISAIQKIISFLFLFMIALRVC
jgi:hypothetical protein